jgi:hypothetical protein
MKPSIPWKKYLSFFGSLAGIILILRQGIIGWSSLPSVTGSRFTFEMAGLALLTALLAMGMPILAFHFLLRGTGATVPLRSIARGYTFSFLPRYLPGSLWGYLSRGEWLERECSVPLAASTTASIFELAASISTCLAFAGYFLLTNQPFAVPVYALLCCVLFLGIVPLGNLLTGVFRSRHVPSFLQRWLPDRAMDIRMWLVAIFLYGVHWLLCGFSLSFVLRFFISATVSEALPNLATLASLYPAAWLAGFLVLIAPAGMGFREAALAGLLIAFGGLPAAAAAATALVLRVVFVIAELLWTLIGLGLRRPSPV